MVGRCRFKLRTAFFRRSPRPLRRALASQRPAAPGKCDGARRRSNEVNERQARLNEARAAVAAGAIAADYGFGGRLGRPSAFAPVRFGWVLRALARSSRFKNLQRESYLSGGVNQSIFRSRGRTGPPGTPRRLGWQCSRWIGADCRGKSRRLLPQKLYKIPSVKTGATLRRRPSGVGRRRGRARVLLSGGDRGDRSNRWIDPTLHLIWTLI